MKRKKKEIDKTISDLWNRIWDLQDQKNKIKKAVLTGEKGDLKMPERRIVPPDEPIPFGGTVDMDCIFEKEPCEQVDVEFTVKETLQIPQERSECMSEKEKKILESITKAVPNMSEFDKGYFLGVGETIAKYKNPDKTDKFLEPKIPESKQTD